MHRGRAIRTILHCTIAGLYLLPQTAPAETDTKTAARPACFGATETREEIRVHRLLDPYPILKSAAVQHKAEALKVSLCRVGDEFEYVISLLQRDGRLTHIWVNASTGKPTIYRGGHEMPNRF